MEWWSDGVMEYWGGEKREMGFLQFCVLNS
jgi:hypothetical protein